MRVSVETASNDALELMGRVLRHTSSLAPAYPLVFQEDLPGRLVTLSADGAVRSACAILERDLRIAGETIRAGLVGSVSTDPEWRGRGLGSRVLKTAEREVLGQGAMFSLLWADEPGFYRSHGYTEIGAELDYVIPADLASALPEAGADTIRPVRSTDFDAVLRLYERHAERVVRNEREVRAMLAAPGVQVLVLDRGGEPAAYACLGRGIDLHDVVHEWGGEPQDVLKLVRALFELRAERGVEDDLFLMVPVSANGSFAALDALGAPSVRGILGMAKLLDVERACDLFVARVPGASTTLETDRPDDHIRIRGPRASMTVDEEALLQLLFAPRAERKRHADLEAATGLDTSALPLTPFVWGLDSI